MVRWLECIEIANCFHVLVSSTDAYSRFQLSQHQISLVFLQVRMVFARLVKVHRSLHCSLNLTVFMCSILPLMYIGKYTSLVFLISVHWELRTQFCLVCTCEQHYSFICIVAESKAFLQLSIAVKYMYRSTQKCKT